MTRFLLGYGMALAGGLLLLAAGAWWSWASDGYELAGPPRPWRVLVVAGWVLFVLGLIIQATGYALIHQFPQPPVGAHI